MLIFLVTEYFSLTVVSSWYRILVLVMFHFTLRKAALLLLKPLTIFVCYKLGLDLGINPLTSLIMLRPAQLTLLGFQGSLDLITDSSPTRNLKKKGGGEIFSIM
jgi:hypothetical protein